VKKERPSWWRQRTSMCW